MQDVNGIFEEHKELIANSKVTPIKLAELMNLLAQNIINNRAAQEVLLKWHNMDHLLKK